VAIALPLETAFSSMLDLNGFVESHLKRDGAALKVGHPDLLFGQDL
jgi:hypothetical protein